MSKRNFWMVSSKTLILLILSAIFLLASCNTQMVDSYWSAEPVRVDGEMTEWVSKPTIYFEDSGVQLGLCNDSQNLYILFRFRNENWARVMRRAGVTLWLDSSGKKKDFGIRYAGGLPLSEMPKPGTAGEGGFWDNLTPEQKERFSQKQQETMAEQLKVIYKKSGQEIVIPVDGSKGPKVSFASTQGIYTYEFKIPLQKTDAFAYAIQSQPGQTIYLGLEWGGFNEGDRKDMMPEGPGGKAMPPGGGRHMPPGGGPPGEGRNGPGMQKPEKQELWLKTKLASPPAQ